MALCKHCDHQLSITQWTCTVCGVQSQGIFGQSRLGRLPGEWQDLAEQILLAGGNLKEVAQMQSISYPTLRKRVDSLIDALKHLRKSDQQEMERLLAEVESGRIQPEEASRRINEINHGS